MMKLPIKNKNSGFTLIELMVVIAIISLLASVILASLTTARAKGRDAKRKIDVHTIATAVEKYYTDHDGTYPVACASTGTGNWDAPFIAALVPAYIPKLPVDPLVNNGAPYYYAFCKVTWGGPCANQYVAYAVTEGNNNDQQCFGTGYYSQPMGY